MCLQSNNSGMHIQDTYSSRNNGIIQLYTLVTNLIVHCRKSFGSLYSYFILVCWLLWERRLFPTLLAVYTFQIKKIKAVYVITHFLCPILYDGRVRAPVHSLYYRNHDLSQISETYLGIYIYLVSNIHLNISVWGDIMNQIISQRNFRLSETKISHLNEYETNLCNFNFSFMTQYNKLKLALQHGCIYRHLSVYRL